MSKSHLCNYNYDNELNLKINKRRITSTSLQPNFDPRPLSTKYSLLTYPLDNKHVKDESEPLISYNNYDSEKIFYPGNSRAPISYFLDNVDTESVLKNQFNSLTKNDGPNYTPNINSDLYNEKIYEDNKESNLHKLPHKIRGADNKKCNLAPNHFFNHTKYNIKNL